MLALEIVSGFILASIALAYWRQALLGLIVLTMVSSVVLAVWR